MRNIALAACLILLSLAVPVQGQTITIAQKADIEKAVKEQVIQYFRAIETMDMEAIFRYWSRENLIAQVTGGRTVTSVDTMMKNWKTAFDNRQAHRFDIQNVMVRVFSPDAAVAVCTGLFRNELKNGNVSNFNYANTMIWIKESGMWKAASLIESTSARQ